MLKSEFAFGEIVRVKGKLARHRANASRWWHRTPLDKPYEAIFLGARYFYNGEVEWESDGPYGEGSHQYFDTRAEIPGALVCQKNHNPVKVFLSDVEKVNPLG